MKKSFRRIKAIILCIILVISSTVTMTGCKKEKSDAIILRISNWEEYIDLGEWEEGDEVELSDGTIIFGENSLVDDFEEWFFETYGKKVKVEYSTFGTNEELYNQITMGDTYDLVCPSEYMIMKMIAENMVVPFSEDFYNKESEYNYYAKNVSPYISEVFSDLSIDGKILSDYAAGYMWGTLGIVYNPEFVSGEEAAHWKILLNEKFRKQITIKDSVRDAYFAGNSIYNEELISSSNFLADEAYAERLSEILNTTDKNTINAVEDILSRIKDNVYSFETDSGKADLVTGKVVANQQWSGDAVYTMDQAEEDGVELYYSAPLEATNLWFDGWVMLEDGIDGDADKQMAAEAFINYVSRPDNAIRNMEYIGYTSVISGGDTGVILDYIDWCYGIEEDSEEEMAEYDVTYFFANPNESKSYLIETTQAQTRRQLYARYPTLEVVERSVVMAYFDKKGNERINRMWTNVRCFDIEKWWDNLFD